MSLDSKGLVALLSGFLNEQSNLAAAQAQRLQNLVNSALNSNTSVTAAIANSSTNFKRVDPTSALYLQESGDELLIDPIKKKKVTRAKADPNKPKQAASAYLLFATDELKKVKLSNPELPQNELMRLVGANWKNISTDEKKYYEDAAKEKKIIYDVEMEKYKETQLNSHSVNTTNSQTVSVSVLDQKKTAIVPSKVIVPITEHDEDDYNDDYNDNDDENN